MYPCFFVLLRKEVAVRTSSKLCTQILMPPLKCSMSLMHLDHPLACFGGRELTGRHECCCSSQHHSVPGSLDCAVSRRLRRVSRQYTWAYGASTAHTHIQYKHAVLRFCFCDVAPVDLFLPSSLSPSPSPSPPPPPCPLLPFLLLRLLVLSFPFVAFHVRQRPVS